MNKLFLLLILLIFSLISCNKQINTNSKYYAVEKHEGSIMYNLEGFKFKNLDQHSQFKKVNDYYKELISSISDNRYDSIINVDFLEERKFNDSLSHIIIKSEHKNSKGYFAGNSYKSKILIIKTKDKLKSISQIHSNWGDGFHIYEKSVIKLNENLYQLNDYIYEFPSGNQLVSFTIFKITDEGLIEILNEEEGIKFKQQVVDNVNHQNSRKSKRSNLNLNNPFTSPL